MMATAPEAVVVLVVVVVALSLRLGERLVEVVTEEQATQIPEAIPSTVRATLLLLVAVMVLVGCKRHHRGESFSFLILAQSLSHRPREHTDEGSNRGGSHP